MSRRTRLILFGLVSVVLVAVAGVFVNVFGGGPTLADAAETVSGKDLQVELETTISFEGDALKMSGIGTARGDGTSSRTEVETTDDAGSAPISVTVLEIGDDVYVKGEVLGRLPGGKTWVHFDPKNAPPSAMGIKNYVEFLHRARDVEKHGTEQISGRSATRYEGVLTAQELADALGRSTGTLLNDRGRHVKMPVRAWLDDEGRLVRVNLRFEVKGTTFKMTTTMLNVAAPVNRTAPPAGEVAEQNEITGG